MAIQSRLLKRLRTHTRSKEMDWEALYREQLPKVYNFFCYRVGDGPVAEDLTATTFEKAWRGRERYRDDLGAFSTWLFTIARNVATDYFRQHRQELVLEDVPNLADPASLEETVQRQDDLTRLSNLLAGLPARERELVALKYGAGLTNRAIAQQTGLSESNVGTILYRVVRRLRTEWEKER
jgi:RNA polymerase sigma-70 factor (ECF subfamily)